MASTLTVTSLSPTRALFEVDFTAGSDVHFKKSGAVGDDKDLGALVSGPLKVYLSRLANWASLSAPFLGAKVCWQRVVTVSATNLPVAGGTSAVDGCIVQAGFTDVVFHPNVGAGAMQVELVFLHSLTR